MNTLLYIAFGYVKGKSRQNVINIINRMTIFVLIVGGASLMVVLSGFAGLKNMGLSFSSFFDPDLTLQPVSGKFIRVETSDIEKLKSVEGVESVSKTLQEKVFLQYQKKNYIASIKGVDSLYNKVTKIDSTLVVSNTFLVDDNFVIVGDGIATSLNVPIYTGEDLLSIVVPTAGKGSIVSSSKPFNQLSVGVSDYYRVSEDLDDKFVFASLSTAQSLLSLPDSVVSSLEVKTSKDFSIADVKKNIQNAFKGRFKVLERSELNYDLHKMYRTENIVTFLVFSFILTIAMFNLSGSIIMIIIDKKTDLKTLYSLGLSVSSLCNIFFLQGLIVSFFGAIIGVALGVCLSLIQMHYPIFFISSTSYYSIPYPMEILFSDVVLVFFTIVCVGAFFSFVGSRRVTKSLILS